MKIEQEIQARLEVDVGFRHCVTAYHLSPYRLRNAKLYNFSDLSLQSP